MSKKQAFIKGTMVLMCANIISKILGAVFKIPLTYLLSEEGMAIYNTAFNVYVMLLSFVISGMHLAISKLIAEELSLENYNNVRKITKISIVLLGALGFIASIILWFGADFFAYASKEPKAIFCLKMLSPSIFFVALGVVFKGFFQGASNMLPTAISQVIEAVVKLLLGFFLALYYSRLSVEHTVAASILGVTAGEIIATFILFLFYLPKWFKMPLKGNTRSSGVIIKTISYIAIPSIIASVLSGALNLIDISQIRHLLERINFTPQTCDLFLRQYSSHTNVFDNLQQSMKITTEGSRWLYGAYSGYALAIFHLPIGILGTIGVSILPVIAGAVATKNQTRIRNYVELSTKITLLIAYPIALILFLFSGEILEILFHNQASSLMLAGLAPCLVFIALFQHFTAILNAKGHIIVPFIYSFCGAILKLILNAIFIPIPQLNMMGVILSANISYLVSMLLVMISARKTFLFIGSPLIYIKPLISSIVMALVVSLIYSPFLIIFKNQPTAFFLSCIIGGISYILMLLSTGSLSREDFKILKV